MSGTSLRLAASMILSNAVAFPNSVSAQMTCAQRMRGILDNSCGLFGLLGYELTQTAGASRLARP